MTESYICGARKKLCPELVVNFGGFNLFERLSERCLKCLELARRVGLDEIEEDDVNSLLKSIGEELSTEELNKLEKQRCQLKEVVEVEQHPMAPLTKQLTKKILQCFLGITNQGLDYLEEVEHDYEWAGLTRCRVMDNLARYEQLLYEKRREATQATLDVVYVPKCVHNVFFCKLHFVLVTYLIFRMCQLTFYLLSDSVILFYFIFSELIFYFQTILAVLVVQWVLCY